MSAWRAFRRPLDIVTRTELLMKAKAIQKPIWFDICKAYGVDPIHRQPQKKKREQSPLDRLLRSYFQKNPGARSNQVVNLHDQREKPPAVLFVSRQLELMRGEKLSEKAAYARTMEELGAPKAVGKAAPASSGALDDTVSLEAQFESWMNAEDKFLDERAKQASRKRKPKSN